MQRIALLILFFSTLPGTARAAASESLGYRVYYQGVLSAMQRVAIVEARLDSRTPDQGGLQVSTLTLSSAGHPLVDSLYPIRYRLRAVADLASGRLLGFERYKHTRKTRQDLAWVTPDGSRVHYLRAGVEARVTPAPLPPRLQPWLDKRGLQPVSDMSLQAMPGVLDRLTLLQRLRRRPPAAGQPDTLWLTDGRKSYSYRVSRVGREWLDVAGRQWDAWKLRVEGYKRQPGSAGPGEPDHAPVTLWLSTAAPHLPLRFHIDHTVGAFTVDLLPARKPPQLTVDVPSARMPVSAPVQDD